MLAMAFPGISGVVAVLVHHRATRLLRRDSCGRRVDHTVQSAIRLHIFLVYLHSASRWSAVLGAWRHRGQDGECAHPLRCSRSDVQTLFCVTSHMKNLHLGGAYDLHK